MYCLFTRARHVHFQRDFKPGERMSKKDELNYEYKRGSQDLKDGKNNPPSENLTNYIKPFNDASVSEKDSAYNAGRSDEGSKKK